MSEEKTRARNDEGKIQKAPEPDATQMIDPFVYKATGRAVNYDRRWAGTVKLGDTVGCWVTTPWNRGHGAAVKEMLNKLREAGRVAWDEDALYFTHAQGVAAANDYAKRVVEGSTIKLFDGTEVVPAANAKSWNNRFEAMTGVKFEDLPQNKEKAKKADSEEATEVSPEEITAAGESVDLGFEESETTDINTVSEGPSDEEILAEAESEPETEALVGEETVSETEQLDESTEEAIAAVTETLDPPADFDPLGDLALDGDTAQLLESKPQQVMDPGEGVDNDIHGYATVRIPSDVTKEIIRIKDEAITWRDEDRNEHTAYFVYIPAMDQDRWLEAGLHIIGDPKTGELYKINVVIGE